MITQQFGVNVHYDGVIVGAYTADLPVENVVLVELKAADAGVSVHWTLCMALNASTI